HLPNLPVPACPCLGQTPTVKQRVESCPFHVERALTQPNADSVSRPGIGNPAGVAAQARLTRSRGTMEPTPAPRPPQTSRLNAEPTSERRRKCRPGAPKQRRTCRQGSYAGEEPASNRATEGTPPAPSGLRCPAAVEWPLHHPD